MKKPRTHPVMPSDERETFRPLVSASLSSSEQVLLDTLTKRLTCMTIAQAETVLSGAGATTPSCRAAISRLERCGLIESASRVLRVTTTPTAPLATWRPHQAEPQFGVVLHAAKSRREQPLSSDRIIAATAAAANLVGGEPGAIPSPHQATHDAQLADVYLWMLRTLPTRARSWRSERVLAREMYKRAQLPRNWRQRRKLVTGSLPDAAVTDGAMRTAIELVGEYTADKLRNLHRTCESAGWGYELW